MAPFVRHHLPTNIQCTLWMILAGSVEGDDESIAIVAPARPVPKGAKVT